MEPRRLRELRGQMAILLAVVAAAAAVELQLQPQHLEPTGVLVERMAAVVAAVVVE
jgi:hypothetical protein